MTAICAAPGISFSQGFHTASNKALKVYNEGVAAFDYVDYFKAEKDFKEAINIDNNFYEAYLMLGELMSKQNKFSEAAVNYRKAVKLDSLYYKPIFFNMANAEMMSGDYYNALVHFNVYQAQEGMSATNKIAAARCIKNCEFALNAIKHPVPFNPVSVGPGINTVDDEYWPSITADGQTLMFTRQPNLSTNPDFKGIVQEDFYISIYSDGKWQKAFNAGAPLNTIQNEVHRHFLLMEAICILLRAIVRAEWVIVTSIFQLIKMASGPNHLTWDLRLIQTDGNQLHP